MLMEGVRHNMWYVYPNLPVHGGKLAAIKLKTSGALKELLKCKVLPQTAISKNTSPSTRALV